MKLPRISLPDVAAGDPAEGRSSARAAYIAFCRAYHGQLAFLLGCAWFLLFFRHPFDFTERFFRVPLLLLFIPVLSGIPRPGVFRYLTRSPLLWAVLLMAAAGCLAAVFSPFDQVRSYKHIVFGWILLALAGATMMIALREKALRLLLLGMSVGVLAAAAWAVVADMAGFAGKEILFQGDRLFLYTGNASTLGLITGYALAGQWYFWKHKRYLLSPKLDILLMAGVFILLLLSQARIALLAVIASALLTLLCASRRPLRTFVLATVAAGCLVGAAILIGQHTPLKDSPAYQRMVVLFIDPLKDRSVLGRLGLWEIGWEVFRERPLTGSGMRMFGPMRAKYLEGHKDELLARYGFVEEEGVHAHNLVLGVLSEMGLAGLVPLLAMCAFILLNARGASPGADKQCLLILFFYLFCQGCADYMLNKIVYSDLLFATIGLFAGVCFFTRGSPQAKPEPPEEPAQHGQERIRA